MGNRGLSAERRSLMLGAILLSAIVDSTQAAATTVPFTLFDNRILVQASVNGAGPFTMIVDTGSNSVLVTPQVARRLGLAPRAAGAATGAGSGSASLSLTQLSSVAIGSLRFDDMPAEVIDLSPLRRAIGFPRLDGIIGYNLLRKLRMGVDMDDRRITFSYAPIGTPKNASTASFTIDSADLVQIPAAVDGVHGTFIVDTGDRFSLTLFRHFARENNFYRDAPARNAITGFGIGGPIYSDVLRTTVSLFGMTIPGVLTRASRDRGGAFASGVQDASIGTGLLKRFNVVYDYPDRQIVAWPSRYFSQADEYRPLAVEHGRLTVQRNAVDPTIVASPLPGLARHGVFGAAVVQGNGGVRATTVVTGSAAASAGLRAGDTIRAIGGEPTATVPQFLMAIHNLHGGDRAVVDVVRNGTALKLTAVLGSPLDERDAGVVTQYDDIVVDDSLRRTLVTMPQDIGARAPAILLIGGIGCYSVDVAATSQDAYMRLTHDLGRAGFVTMRVEKSGVGDSQGPPCRHVDFESEMRGYAAALAALQRNPHVDRTRIYLLGHSIGTIVAPLLALQNHVAGVIVLEAVGRDWPEYEVRNLRRDLELDGETPAATDTALIEKAQCMQRLLFEYEPEAVIEQTVPSCRVHNGIYPVSATYMQQVAHLDVIAPWPKLGIPVLAVYGTSDFETELADHERIVAVVKAAHPQSATLVVLPAMSHKLGRAASPKAAETDDENGTVEPYDSDVSHAIISWLRSLPTLSS